MRTSASFAVAAAVLLLSGRAAAATPRNFELAPSARDPFAHVAGEHTTEFAVDRAHAGRAHNVALAAQRLDGAILEPGATFSFNERVGERTLEAGFEHAPELHDGHLHEGVGGGVCQVATTLHVASLEAGLEIVEHRAHSIPLHYADAGLDATVYYGRIDFRVRNPYAFSVRVRATTTPDGSLTIRLEATEHVASATVETRTIRTLEATEETISDPSLAPGAREIEDRGRDGLVVRVRATREDGTQIDRIVRYSASPRVVRVAL